LCATDKVRALPALLPQCTSPRMDRPAASPHDSRVSCVSGRVRARGFGGGTETCGCCGTGGLPTALAALPPPRFARRRRSSARVHTVWTLDRVQDGRAPLHLAAYQGHYEVVEMLIKHQADVTATTGVRRVCVPSHAPQSLEHTRHSLHTRARVPLRPPRDLAPLTHVHTPPGRRTGQHCTQLRIRATWRW
jgi:Ankyrin repeats (3 copies)